MKVIENYDDWVDPSTYLERLFVELSCRDNLLVDRIVGNAKLPVEYLDERELSSLIEGENSPSLGEGKRNLILSNNKGDFVKDCPATKTYRCCDYRIINIGTGCPMDCVYCILQAYLNNPNLTFYVNTDRLFNELDELLNSNPDKVVRIGTGELTDSMALDRITGFSRDLIAFFSEYDNGVLELKTKSSFIENLKNVNHAGRTVMSWSLNTNEITSKTEFRASSIESRLHAAKQCGEMGYHLGFHFDPIIDYPGWQEGYHQTIEMLFKTIPAEKIKWISLGAFRYVPDLKKVGTRRFPESSIFYHEFVKGLDGKQRYFRSQRTEIYSKIYNQIKRFASPETCIYFCMESDEIWKEVMGFTPKQQGGLPEMLDKTFC